MIPGTVVGCYTYRWIPAITTTPGFLGNVCLHLDFGGKIESDGKETSAKIQGDRSYKHVVLISNVPDFQFRLIKIQTYRHYRVKTTFFIGFLSADFLFIPAKSVDVRGFRRCRGKILPNNFINETGTLVSVTFCHLLSAKYIIISIMLIPYIFF